MSTVQGRYVLVTGASRGIGRELVRAAVERGASQVYAAARDPDSIEPGDRIVPVRLDVTDRTQIDAAAAALPDVDLVVSNAGVACYGPAMSVDEHDLRLAMEVNFLGPLALARAFRPDAGMVFVLSVAALALSRSAPGYSASKAAGLMAALAVREELPGSAVSIVLPGFVDTDMSAQLTMPKESPRTVASRILDGWADGETTVWPDAFAGLVRDTVEADYLRLLDRPREVMTEIQRSYRPTTT